MATNSGCTPSSSARLRVNGAITMRLSSSRFPTRRGSNNVAISFSFKQIHAERARILSGRETKSHRDLNSIHNRLDPHYARGVLRHQGGNDEPAPAEDKSITT